MATDFSKFLFCECTGMTSFVLKFGVKKPKMGDFLLIGIFWWSILVGPKNDRQKLPISKKSKSLSFLTPNFNTKLVIPVHSQKKNLGKKIGCHLPPKIKVRTWGATRWDKRYFTKIKKNLSFERKKVMSKDVT